MAVGERQEHWGNGGDVVELLRAQLAEVHRQLDEGFGEWLRGLAPAAPPPGSRGVALYVHAATVEDITINAVLRQTRPAYDATWAGRGPGHYSTADLGPVRDYARQVFAATDAYLAELSSEQVSQTVDLARLGLGRPTVAWVLSRFVILQLAQIYGELLTATQLR